MLSRIYHFEATRLKYVLKYEKTKIELFLKQNIVDSKKKSQILS